MYVCVSVSVSVPVPVSVSVPVPVSVSVCECNIYIFIFESVGTQAAQDSETARRDRDLAAHVLADAQVLVYTALSY
jgi:hypothetical protein